MSLLARILLTLTGFAPILFVYAAVSLFDGVYLTAAICTLIAYSLSHICSSLLKYMARTLPGRRYTAKSVKAGRQRDSQLPPDLSSSLGVSKSVRLRLAGLGDHRPNVLRACGGELRIPFQSDHGLHRLPFLQSPGVRRRPSLARHTTHALPHRGGTLCHQALELFPVREDWGANELGRRSTRVRYKRSS